MKLRYDRPVALLFLFLTLAFVGIAMTNTSFFNWVFERHHNQWSWYLRPVFLLPFCYFAYRHSWSGISITVFALFTSMCWFPAPASTSEQVQIFLRFEKDWLYGEWNLTKTLLTLTIPVSFALLALAFWKRSLIMGIAVLVLMATGKMIWSVTAAGESGKSVLLPAAAGLLLCVGLTWFGFRRLERKRRQQK